MTLYNMYPFLFVRIISHYHLVKIVCYEKYHIFSGSFVKRMLLEDVILQIVEFNITSMGKKIMVIDAVS